MRDAIQLLTRLVAALARRQEVGIGHADRSVSARVRGFINLDPPVFTGADPNEDAQVFIDRVQRTLRLDMNISRIQAYAQGVKERKQKQRMNPEHDRAQNKRARALGPQYRGESSQIWPPLPRCAQCGKQHAGQCRMGLGVCYTCGYPGHVMRDYPMRGDASMA
ncbi:PREDICTED: uncharacterized protein LOC109206585 [Nicotiana attenuata]|uniref:uncharacterized protein LOC109206585 n=1 Tax=Nicotiana attenuata TaxID=49451 RepID=UPI000904E8FB|nr:PREDICTED: uncharacterized protein LOC109206585 [Nicotiana attenuata]